VFKLKCVAVLDLPPDPTTTHQPAQDAIDGAEAPPEPKEGRSDET
jgi:hypothetical protein